MHEQAFINLQLSEVNNKGQESIPWTLDPLLK